MKERDYSVKVMTTAQKALRGSEVIKHSDRFTAGVPDISISWIGFTNWIEDKVIRGKQTLRSVIGPDQILQCTRLATATDGRCWIVVFDEALQRTTIWLPRMLGLILIQKANSPEVIRAMQAAQHAYDFDEMRTHGANFDGMVTGHGCLTIEGLHPEIVTTLISDATIRRPRAAGRAAII